MDIFNSVCDELTNCFGSSGNKFFVGGSVRFGYKNARSDIDYFVLSNNELLKYLKENQFQKVNDGYEFSSHYRLVVGNRHVDVILLDESQYLLLHNEHQEVENFLTNILNDDRKLCYQTEFMQFLTFLKYDLGINGKNFYRTIRKYIMKYHKNLVRKEK